MSVLSVDEMMEERSGSWTVSDGRKYTRKFRVLTNSIFDGPNTAIQAVASEGLARGTPYLSLGAGESDPNAFVTELSAVAEEGDGLGWQVSVIYGWYSVNEAGGGPEQNPLLMPIDVSWSFRDIDHVVQKDMLGNPCLNSAGDPYNPPLKISLPNQMMTVVRNEPSYDAAFAYNYRNAINVDSFAGQSAKFAKVLGITPKNLFHQDVGWYYQVTYEFEFMNPRASADGQGFRREELDIGTRVIDQNTGKPVPIALNGIPVTTPMLLNGKGKLLPLNGTPVYNIYFVYNELPFSEFNFDVAAITGNRSGFP